MASLGFSMYSIMSSANSDSFINEFHKVTGYKTNIQKFVAFLYANNKLSEREIKGKITFTITPKRIKYKGINLSKEAKGPYSENYETLMKEDVVYIHNRILLGYKKG